MMRSPISLFRRSRVVLSVLSFERSASAIPKGRKPRDFYDGGEDAFFIHHNALCVADGVGGWNEVGVDPSIFSNALVKGAKEALSHTRDPHEILSAGHACARVNKGSTTAVLALLEHDNEGGAFLQIANAGDSCAMVLGQSPLRSVPVGDASYTVTAPSGPFHFALKTQEWQHRWNFPVQISFDDLPHAQLLRVPVSDGDLVLLGSDGLFDNAFPEQIVSAVVGGVKKHAPHGSLGGDSVVALDGGAGSPLHLIAQDVSAMANALAHTQGGVVPFVLSALQQLPASQVGKVIGPGGGKIDDITVVLGQVRIR